MKGAIISPLWFYFIDLLESLGFILMVVTIILLGISLVFFVAGGIVYLDAFDEDDEIKAKAIVKECKKFLIPALIVGTLWCAIPSKETMYTMMVANFVTYENVDNATKVIKDSVDYVMEKLGDTE